MKTTEILSTSERRPLKWKPRQWAVHLNGDHVNKKKTKSSGHITEEYLDENHRNPRYIWTETSWMETRNLSVHLNCVHVNETTKILGTSERRSCERKPLNTSGHRNGDNVIENNWIHQDIGTDITRMQQIKSSGHWKGDHVNENNWIPQDICMNRDHVNETTEILRKSERRPREWNNWNLRDIWTETTWIQTTEYLMTSERRSIKCKPQKSCVYLSGYHVNENKWNFWAILTRKSNMSNIKLQM